MPKRAPLKRVLFVYVLGPVLVVLFTLFSLLNIGQSSRVVNATATSTLNFQARLLTIAGGIVPDGNYNVEFKIYNAASSSGSSQGTCGTDANCLWGETRTSGNTVAVKDG